MQDEKADVATNEDDETNSHTKTTPQRLKEKESNGVQIDEMHEDEAARTMLRKNHKPEHRLVSCIHLPLRAWSLCCRSRIHLPLVGFRSFSVDECVEVDECTKA